MVSTLAHPAPFPARGSYADGFEPVARQFALQLERDEVGAAFSVYQRGRAVVDLWGGTADVGSSAAWERDTRIVVFSVTKGFAAMALASLADRGQLEWDAPVATYWPGFARGGKGEVTLKTLFNHQAGVPCLDRALTLTDFSSSPPSPEILQALEQQQPIWSPGEGQGYHATTFGMYATELFERIAGESMGEFLRRELFEPLGSDARLGTPESEDAKVATLYTPRLASRLRHTIGRAILHPESAEARIFRDVLRRDSVARRAFATPATGPRGVEFYNDVELRRTQLAWASATASADGVARAYLPFAGGGVHDDFRYLGEATVERAYERQGWSERDAVLQKPVGWSGGFLKEETHLFSPNAESFGHAGMGGALGWADPRAGLAWGYVMNKMDWRVRSPRALGLCHALYECEPVRQGQ